VAADENPPVRIYLRGDEPDLNAAFYKGGHGGRLWLDSRPRAATKTKAKWKIRSPRIGERARRRRTPSSALEAWLEVIASLEDDAGQFTVQSAFAAEWKACRRAGRGGAGTDRLCASGARLPLTGDWHRHPRPLRQKGTTTADMERWDARGTIWLPRHGRDGQSAARGLAVGRGNLPSGETSPPTCTAP